MRTIINLPNAQAVALDEFCARQNISRAEAIRRAVNDLLARQKHCQRDSAFGSWAPRNDIRATVDALRSEWE